METFSFDVEVSNHDALQQGITARRLPGSQYTWHRITVAAESIEEAALIAAQMASATCGMCTALFPRI